MCVEFNRNFQEAWLLTLGEPSSSLPLCTCFDIFLSYLRNPPFCATRICLIWYLKSKSKTCQVIMYPRLFELKDMVWNFVDCVNRRCCGEAWGLIKGWWGGGGEREGGLRSLWCVLHKLMVVSFWIVKIGSPQQRRETWREKRRGFSFPVSMPSPNPGLFTWSCGPCLSRKGLQAISVLEY